MVLLAPTVTKRHVVGRRYAHHNRDRDSRHVQCLPMHGKIKGLRSLESTGEFSMGVLTETKKTPRFIPWGTWTRDVRRGCVSRGAIPGKAVSNREKLGTRGIFLCNVVKDLNETTRIQVARI